MKHPPFLVLAFALFLTGCNSCSEEERKYDVMQRYGGWTARVDETRSKVSYIEDNYHSFVLHQFDSIDHLNFSTEYPYWQQIKLYVDETGMRKVTMLSDTSQGRRTENLYFEDAVLIYAIISEKEKDSLRKNEYFFEQNTLVYALDTDGNKSDITDARVQTASIDLLREAGQIQEIISKKQIKP